METFRSVFMDSIEGDTSRRKPTEVLENFEATKSMFEVEVAHVFFVNIKRVGRYAQEIETLTLSATVKESLKKVFDLMNQKQFAVSSSGLLELAGLKGLDTGKDVEQSMNKWNSALEGLRKARE